MTKLSTLTMAVLVLSAGTGGALVACSTPFPCAELGGTFDGDGTCIFSDELDAGDDASTPPSITPDAAAPDAAIASDAGPDASELDAADAAEDAGAADADVLDADVLDADVLDADVLELLDASLP